MQGRQLDAVTTSKFTERSWQLKRLQLTSMKEQFELELRPSSEQEKALREFLQRQNVFLSLSTGFPLSSNRHRCTAMYSAI